MSSENLCSPKNRTDIEKSLASSFLMRIVRAMPFSHATDDPGGNAEPRFHEGQLHRPIERLVDNKEYVQLTIAVRVTSARNNVRDLFRHIEQHALTIGTNGDRHTAAISNGRLRYPSGDQPDGTTIHAFPSVLVRNHDDTAAVEAVFLEQVQAYANTHEGIEVEGFIPSGRRARLALETEELLRRAAARQPRRAQSDTMSIDADNGGESVQLDYETTPRNGQHGQEHGDAVDSEAVYL